VDNRFLAFLIITVTVETLVLALGVRSFVHVGRPPLSRVVFAGFLASFATLPYFWFLVPRFASGPSYLPVGEGLVILTEAIILRFVLELSNSRSLLLSAACNLCSMTVGLLILRAGA
jgi:hypothetical protein